MTSALYGAYLAGTRVEPFPMGTSHIHGTRSECFANLGGIGISESDDSLSLADGFLSELAFLGDPMAEKWEGRFELLESEGRDASAFANVLRDRLATYAAPYCAFGTRNTGEYGFWIDHAAIRRAIEQGRARMVPYPPKDPSDVSDAFRIDAAGLTFYRFDGSAWSEVWTVG